MTMPPCSYVLLALGVTSAIAAPAGACTRGHHPPTSDDHTHTPPLAPTNAPGFEELRRRDERLEPFASQLLSRRALSLDRQALTRSANDALDAQLRPLLALLCDQLLRPACFQVLELLVRVYRVHERNVDDLLAAALPYHASNEFVRICQLCSLAPNGLWAWLAPVQRGGAALLRTVLVQRCVNDRAVFELVCRAAAACRTPRTLSRVQLGFFAVLSCEVLAAMRKVRGVV